MIMKVVDPSVPAGVYRCGFVGLEEAETEFGSKYRWIFEVLDGPHAGKQTSGFSSREPNARNKCGTFLCALVGKPPTVDTEIDPYACIGRTYSVVVRDTEGGKQTTVDSFTLLEALQPAAAAAEALVESTDIEADPSSNEEDFPF